MLELSMGSALTRRFWVYVSALVGVIALLIALSFFLMPRVHGQGAGGGEIGSCGSNYCTDNGFGWKKYSSTGDGPSGGLNNWSWSDVKNTCKNVESVWLFVVKSSKTPTTWRAFPFKHGDGIQDDVNGAYMKAHYQGDDVPTNVKKLYEEALAQGVSGVGGQNLTWGNDLEWFCYGQKPWKVAVTTSANSTTVEVGQTVTWKHTISVTENTTTADVSWRAVNSGALGSGTVDTWTYASGKNKPSLETKETAYTVQPADFGKRLCRYTLATPASDKGGETKTDPVCVTVIKRPKVQILGADAFVRGNIITSTSNVGGKKYGSWGQYGISATGTITNMGSGSSYAQGSIVSTCSLNLITFSNVTSPAKECNSSTKFGQYGTLPSSMSETLSARFSVNASTPKLSAATNLNDLDSGLTYTAGATTVRITSSTPIAKGKWVVINAPTATVRIEQNINYTTETLGSVKDIPQIVIIANNIIIADSVTRVDAWLVAKGDKASGTLVTCDAAGNEPANLSAAVCNKKLIVNGPVATDRLYLYRTYGAESGALAIQAGEEFNLRSDAYLWAADRAGDSTRIQTVTTREVPVRF